MNVDQATAVVYAAAIKHPPCEQLDWDHIEKQHAAARTPTKAAVVAAEAMTACDHCPFLQLCEQWAIADAYTGLAAGSAWKAGRRRRVGRVARGPIRHRYTQAS